ncbi:MAG: cell wall hydrolase [Caulobacteraceae bacterium]
MPLTPAGLNEAAHAAAPQEGLTGPLLRLSTPFRILAALALVAGALCACVTPRAGVDIGRAAGVASLAQGFSEDALVRMQGGMDPAMLLLAQRFDPASPGGVWGAPQGWTLPNLEERPVLALERLGGGQARRLNAFMPADGGPLVAAQPFYLRAASQERERAVLCLTEAIYYEAALEPQAGQEAVAQTVLNRVRHPAFPKTVCGVVFQGSSQITGCQFSFTCDGSRERAPVAAIWAKCKRVAERALAGYVQTQVGTATFYHADYVFPRWSPSLAKITQIGAHIFYRFKGAWGRVEALSGRYTGRELAVSMAGPPREALLAAQAAAAADAEGVQTVMVPDPTAPGGMRARVSGQVVFGRRIPTREEIAAINARIAEVEKTLPQDAPAAPDPAPEGESR